MWSPQVRSSILGGALKEVLSSCLSISIRQSIVMIWTGRLDPRKMWPKDFWNQKGLSSFTFVPYIRRDPFSLEKRCFPVMQFFRKRIIFVIFKLSFEIMFVSLLSLKDEIHIFPFLTVNTENQPLLYVFLYKRFSRNFVPPFYLVITFLDFNLWVASMKRPLKWDLILKSLCLLLDMKEGNPTRQN